MCDQNSKVQKLINKWMWALDGITARKEDPLPPYKMIMQFVDDLETLK